MEKYAPNYKHVDCCTNCGHSQEDECGVIYCTNFKDENDVLYQVMGMLQTDHNGKCSKYEKKEGE